MVQGRALTSESTGDLPLFVSTGVAPSSVLSISNDEWWPS